MTPRTDIYVLQVYVTAIQGHVPSKMVKCVAAFVNCCYIVRHNAITKADLDQYCRELARFHELRTIFVETGVRQSVELPRQHSLMHYADGIELFGSPNGVCSSITESKHIKAIKEPWRRSSRCNALYQMLRTIAQLEKLAAIRTVFKNRGMLVGSVSEYVRACNAGIPPPIRPFGSLGNDSDEALNSDGDEGGGGGDGNADGEEDDSGSPADGARRATEIRLAVTRRRYYLVFGMGCYL
jgi:hypothetical protein